jgi:hypothetical protein
MEPAANLTWLSMLICRSRAAFGHKRVALAATMAAFAPQYGEFGGFGAIRRARGVAGPINSSKFVVKFPMQGKRE